MAVSKWLMRRTFDEAASKAEALKAAAEIKKNKNSGLFTPSQENLRRELGLGNQVGIEGHVCCTCDQIKTQMRPSRSHLRIRIRNS
ncbi:MAG: hypothetical protein NTX12_03550 [Actinobacteria bacterium]|nr:hypothetical protein [Actinomycetota bacterium]